MRLIRHLNEQQFSLNYEKNIEAIAEVLDKDCKKAINEMDKANALLYRGFTISVDEFKKHKTRTNRRPLDTSHDMHLLLDKTFKDKFGWKPRSQGLICTNASNVAYDYGKIRAVFPIGNYKCIWSPNITDVRTISPHWAESFERNPKHAIGMYMKYSSKRKKYGDIDLNADWDSQMDQMDKIINKIIKDGVSKFKQTGLKEPLSSNIDLEIMMKCKEYYSIAEYIAEYVARELNIEYDSAK